MSSLKVIQLLPELNIGGVERGTKDFSKYLVEKGNYSIVISNGGIYEDEIINDGGRHIKLPIHKKRFTSLLLSKKLRSIYEQEKPDIVHVRSRMPAWINYFAYKKLSLKPKLISTFHGLYSTPSYSKVMSRADHMIAISNTVKQYIINTYNIPENNITTIPRGCDIKRFNLKPLSESYIKSWYNEFPQTKNKIILTLPTRISKWKGVDSFIDLFSVLNDDKYHGLIVGPVSKSKQRYFKKLQNKISNQNLSHKITFTGSRNDIAEIYKISDIVFNLSIKPEPFGRTTIEAISCGSKFIGWDHGGTQEILDELYPTGLVLLNDMEQLKNKVLEVTSNKNKPTNNIYTSEKMTSETLNLYHQLLKRDL